MTTRLSIFCATLMSGLFWLLPAVDTLAQDATPNWKDDWSLAPGFAIDADTVGFSFPSDIEFVPNPGSEPDDPLYFVLELKGTLKVVTNDRTVHTFAQDFIPVPLKKSFQEIGAAGMCLDPSRGYVYVTFGYLDRTQVFRNGMVRFSATPETFGRTAGERLFLLDLFADERADTSHQIGPCAISNDQLFVPVGYGKERTQSQNLQTTLGSILRMDLDFKPIADNPFATDDGEDTAVDYIWTYGHRNVFGLDFVGDRLIITENGGSIDRLLEVEGGKNYLWRGDDWSIAARADFIFGPAVGLVQLDYLPETSDVFPEAFRNQFYIALAGGPGAVGPGLKGERSISMLRYDFGTNRVVEPPNMLVAYRGSGMQLPVSVAFGPDALYFVALLPQSDGTTPVMKITYDPDRGHPHVLGRDVQPEVLINEYGCRQCHRIGASGGKFGPRLSSAQFDSIRARINGPDYPAHVATIDALEEPLFMDYREARREILGEEGEQRLKRWLATYLLNPAFDNPESKMPSPGVTPAHAKIIADYLIRITNTPETEAVSHGPLDRLRFAIAGFFPDLRYRHLIGAFVVGSGIGLVFTFGLVMLFWRKRQQ
jgi:hypothetical protein